MHIEDPILSTVARWVGRSFTDLPCWPLIREAYKLRRAELPAVDQPSLELLGDYYATLFAGRFIPIYEPEPWAIVPMREHELAVATHAALCLTSDYVIHSHASAGVVIEPLRRGRIWNRILREPNAPQGAEPRRVFLRLRE